MCGGVVGSYMAELYTDALCEPYKDPSPTFNHCRREKKMQSRELYSSFHAASTELKADKQHVMRAVKSDGNLLCHAAISLRADEEVVLEAVKRRPSAFQYAADALRADKEFVAACGVRCLQYASDDLKLDKAFVLRMVSIDGRVLSYVSDCLRADREVVTAAIKNNAMAYAYANESLQADKDIALLACNQYYFCNRAFCAMPQGIRADEEIIFAVLTQECSPGGDWVNYEQMPSNLHDDRGFVLTAVRLGRDGRNLWLAGCDSDLYHDYELVLAAVKQNWTILNSQFSSIQDHHHIIYEAIQQNGNALEYAGENLRSNKRVVLDAVRQTGSALRFASDDLKVDEHIAAIAEESIRENIKFDGRLLQYAPAWMKADKQIVLDAVQHDGNSLRFASTVMLEDKEIVLAAVRQNRNALWYTTLSDDTDVILAAVTAQQLYAQIDADGLRISALSRVLLQLYPLGQASSIVEAGKKTFCASISLLVKQWHAYESHEEPRVKLIGCWRKWRLKKAKKDWIGAKGAHAAGDGLIAKLEAGGYFDIVPLTQPVTDVEKPWSFDTYGKEAGKVAIHIGNKCKTLLRSNQHRCFLPHLCKVYTREEVMRGEDGNYDEAVAYKEAATVANELASNIDSYFPTLNNCIWGPLQRFQSW